jgi:O-antigen/teichoic acid export membrane protein
MILVRDRFRFLFSATKGAGAIAQTVFARFLIAGVNVCTGIISARVLGSNGRGEMSAMLVWPALLAYVLTLGLPAAIRYLIRREPERRKELFTMSVIGAGLSSLVAIAIGVTFIPTWLHAYPADVIRGAQIMMAFSPEVMLGLITTAMLETLGEFHTANQTRYAVVLLTLAGLIVLALGHILTPFTGALAYTGAPVVVALWIAWYLRAHFDLRVLDPRRTIRDLTSYGFRAYGIDLLSAISQQIDQVLVIAFLSASDVGIYVVALNASRVINILHSAVVSVVFPSASGLDTDQVVEMVGRSARVSTLVAVAFAGALAIVLPFLIPLFYGGAFARGIVVAQVLTLEAVLSGLVSVLTQAFMALGKPGIVTILQAVGLAAVLPLMVVLLPHFGLIGAALALVLSTVLRLVLVLVAFPGILKAPMPGFIPMREDFARLRGALSNR